MAEKDQENAIPEGIARARKLAKGKLPEHCIAAAVRHLEFAQGFVEAGHANTEDFDLQEDVLDLNRRVTSLRLDAAQLGRQLAEDPLL